MNVFLQSDFLVLLHDSSGETEPQAVPTVAQYARLLYSIPAHWWNVYVSNHSFLQLLTENLGFKKTNAAIQFSPLQSKFRYQKLIFEE